MTSVFLEQVMGIEQINVCFLLFSVIFYCKNTQKINKITLFSAVFLFFILFSVLLAGFYLYWFTTWFTKFTKTNAVKVFFLIWVLFAPLYTNRQYSSTAFGGIIALLLFHGQLTILPFVLFFRQRTQEIITLWGNRKEMQ